MIAKRLVSAMNASSSDTALSDDGLYKIKQKISANKSQRKIKKIMKEKEKANPNTSSNRPSSSIDETVSKYAHPVQYKISQFKKRVKGKIEDVGAEIKKKSMIRKQNRAAAGGEGGFTVGNCGPNGCKLGDKQPGTGAAKTAWMRKN